MRLPEAIALAALACVATSACSRLTFVKPKAGRGSYEQVAPEYTFRQDAASKQRSSAQDHIARAEQRLRAGQLDGAEADAKAAIKANPKSPDGYTLMGAISDQRGKSAQAGSYYAKAAEFAPAQGSALNNYGTWLCGNGRAAESLAWFDRALADRTYSSPASALANGGACALRAGDMARAERGLRDGLALDAENQVALAAMAELQYRNGRYMEARAFSERRLAVAPATAPVLQLASQIEKKLGDMAAAARYVQRLWTEFPQVPVAQPGEGGEQ